MVLRAGSILKYSPTLLTTLKSECHPHANVTFQVDCSNQFLRVLLASIHNLGQCLCPRCTIPMSCVHNLGMTQDTKEWNTLSHIDDHVRQNKIKSMQAHIYDSELRITSTSVKGLLKDQSLVPTTVSLYVSLQSVNCDLSRTHFPINLHVLVSTYSACWLLTLCTSLN